MQVQTLLSHFLAEQPQASGFPPLDLSFPICRMEGVAMGQAGGRVSCSFQLRFCRHELVSEAALGLGQAW